MFKKAQRKQAKLRLALAGPSGSGKTYSALLIAKGLGGPIAMIDTERGSGELYSGLMDYDVAQLTPPFEPQKYIAAIKAAETAGYQVLIIDSLSHAWAGEGGVLDIHDRVAKSTRNSFTAWREVTPQHNALVDAMLQSPCHVIVTLRTKTAYEVQQDEKKTKVVKVGLSPIQRDGLEYEFTVLLDLSIEGHVATSSKDRTGLFDGKYFPPSEATGKLLLEWLDSGAVPEPLSISGSPKEEAFTLLEQLGLADTEPYERYVCSRYQIQTLDQISPAQWEEQVTMLNQCRKNNQKHRQFLGILRQQKAA